MTAATMVRMRSLRVKSGIVPWYQQVSVIDRVRDARSVGVDLLVRFQLIVGNANPGLPASPL